MNHALSMQGVSVSLFVFIQQRLKIKLSPFNLNVEPPSRLITLCLYLVTKRLSLDRITAQSDLFHPQ